LFYKSIHSTAQLEQNL